MQETSHWNEKNLSIFKSVLTLDPDALPCDLAIVCRKRCIEVRISFPSDRLLRVTVVVDLLTASEVDQR